MARIKGLNDKVTLKSRPPKPAITVWKGAKKSAKSAGESLGSKFRIEAPAHLRKALCRAYKTQEKDGSILVEQLNLVPAYEDELQAFDSKMASFNASRPLLFCDRARIHTKFIEAKSQTGGIYYQPIEGNDPCPVSGNNFDCPNKCSRTGDFYFYIYELLLLGYSDLARIQVHGVSDNQHLAEFLDQTKADIGAIKKSPFVSEETRQYIIYQMVRRKVQAKFPIKEGGVRTAKRGTKEDWIINLTLHPIWQKRYDYHKQAQNLIAENYQPSMKLVEQIHGSGLISPALSTATALPSANPQGFFLAFKQKLAEAYKNNAWNRDGWEEMMRDNFEQTEVTDDLDLKLLLAIAQSSDERNRWCDF